MNVAHLRLVAGRILSNAKAEVLSQVRERLKRIIKSDDDTASNIANGVDISALSAFGSGEFVDLLGENAQKSGEQFLLEVGVPRDSGLFQQLNVRSVAYAKSHAANLVTGIEDATREDIGDIIAGGLEEGLTFQQVSEKLEEMYSFSAERADLIARTENAISNNHGVLNGMKELRDQGVIIKKAWNPDAEACEICLENADDGFIDLDDVFSSGDDAPAAHPNCECNLISQIDGENDDSDSTDNESD